MLHAIETAEGRNEADLKECNILTVRACGSLLVGRQVMHMEWQQSKQLPFYITLKHCHHIILSGRAISLSQTARRASSR